MSKQLGTLVVVVLKAKNLFDKHSFYKQDPFTQITLNGTTYRTEVDVKGGQHPEWDAEFRFPIQQGKEEKERIMEIICFRKEPRKDEEIGKGRLDIASTIKTGEFDDWVNIEDSGGVFRGEVYLEMTFFAAGPPPLERRASKLKPTERLTHLNQPQALHVAGARPHGAGQHLKPNPAPARYEAPLPAIPEPTEVVVPANVPSMLRPGRSVSGPVSIPNSSGREVGVATISSSRLSSSQSPPSGRHALPASLAVGHQPATTHQHSHDRTPSLPSSGNSRPVSHSPYQTSVPQYSIPITNGSPTHQPQHTQTDYGPPASHHYDPQAPSSPRYDSNPYLVSRNEYNPSPAPAPTRNYNLSPAPVNDYSTPQSQLPDHPTPFFPTPQIIVGSALPSYSNHPALPQVLPASARPPSSQAQSHPYHAGYPPIEPSIYPPEKAPYHLSSSPSLPPQQQPYHYNYRPPPQPQSSIYGSPVDSDPELADPHLLARYSSPLPLPPDERKHSYRPAPSPPTLSPPDNRFPQSAPGAGNGNAREEAWRREKEQEESDLELARRLDRELNLMNPSDRA